jgi:2,4-didehydro-3-deoxy-L-rhamnonate hydrolase
LERYHVRNILTASLLSLCLVACVHSAPTYPSANFPDAVAIAPTDQALTFARTGTVNDARLFAVKAFNADQISVIELTEAFGTRYQDPIDLFNAVGYEGIRVHIEGGDAEKLAIAPGDLIMPVNLTNAHIAAGTNFAAHAEESSVEDGPFLFAKPVTPTPHDAAVEVGDALLDYEVELAYVTLTDAPLNKVPQNMGIILANDFTDRATLLRLINTDDVTSGDGFATGKGGEGYLPVGNLFVIPRNFETFVADIDLKLAVNGKLRQQAPMTLAIWDIHELFRQIKSRQATRWSHKGEEIGLPLSNGAIPARTLILAGTPDGTVFAGIPKRTMAAGALRWLAGGWGKPLPQHVIERYIKSAKKKGNFLQPGDAVSIHVDNMGTLINAVE